MGNLIQIDRFHCDELSEQANEFINTYRTNWATFILQVQIAVKKGDQQLLNAAINRLAPCFDEEENPKELWEELWSWVVRNNKDKWSKRNNAKG